VLARAGYATRAFTSGGFVNSVFGLDQGFDAFSEIDPIPAEDSHYGRKLARKYGAERAAELLASQGFAAVERWLDERSEQPFFLFLHTYAVHDYDAPKELLRCQELGCAHPPVTLSTRNGAEAAAFTPEMRAHVEHLYDAALRHTDARLGQLLVRLTTLGLAENTLVVVTSDHGEEFFEHGHLQHGRTLYEELLRIPLVFAGPGVPERVLTRPAMQVDVLPTVLARLGIDSPAQVQGVDLLGREWRARAVWSEVDSRFAHKYALRAEDGAKTIHGPSEGKVVFPNERAWERYELGQDPGERHDLAEGDADGLAERQRALETMRKALEGLGEELGPAGHGQVDPETLQDLEALGYGGEEEEE
jgi:arylsulfatase A-like enzyme